MADCGPPPRDAESIGIRHVHDGDTLILEDERRLRLLGFNTPEIERRERPAEPLGMQAREQLVQWIENSGRRIRLQYDAEGKDRYGRTLAHAFLEDGRSIAELMLEAGLATTLIIPPNLQHASCYAEAEQKARAQKRGVWALPSHQPVGLEELRYHRDRYTVLRSRVLKLEQNVKGFIIWLGTYENAVRVYIAADDLELFPQKRLKTLAGHEVEIRGWLHRRDKVWTMQLRHPAQFDIQ
ncbi:MAG TPA: thermonuclease family protein [Gammaproteobacteria bacterium]|nr:thermonuclease family protein [Gammaproteobacteria bacterium]